MLTLKTPSFAFGHLAWRCATPDIRPRTLRRALPLISRAIILGVIIGAPVGGLCGAAEAWRAYQNGRFGTRAQIPAGWKALPPPANGDGIIVVSPDGRGRVTISGGFVLGAPEEELTLRAQPDEGETISYKKQGADWIVVSGVIDATTKRAAEGAIIFYRRTVLSCQGAIANSAALEYPEAEKAAYDEIVKHVAGSLRGGEGLETRNCSKNP